MIGVLVTVLVQSSSTSTSIIVSLVGAGGDVLLYEQFNPVLSCHAYRPIDICRNYMKHGLLELLIFRASYLI